MGKSLINKLYLKRHLYDLKILEGRNLLEHINMFSIRILNQVNRVDVKKEDNDKAVLLLTFLICRSTWCLCPYMERIWWSWEKS